MGMILDLHLLCIALENTNSEKEDFIRAYSSLFMTNLWVVVVVVQKILLREIYHP
jgi:hypothetical protein